MLLNSGVYFEEFCLTEGNQPDRFFPKKQQMKKNRVPNGSPTEVTDSLFQNNKYQPGPSTSDWIH